MGDLEAFGRAANAPAILDEAAREPKASGFGQWGEGLSGGANLGRLTPRQKALTHFKTIDSVSHPDRCHQRPWSYI
ncbi:hypothetical protein ACQP25_29215 [Microtetraspora malaysiensis]|uniref:hypothetical protein n=1 Tax=Microtetraspora malaysiensis TaxID=161358 RepID=UPI003D8C4833